MCGIAGYIGYDDRMNADMLRRMQSALAHRGPDDAGLMTRVREAKDQPPLRIGMAHTRLSILDLSFAGHQPMATADQAHWICYNGEFYNSPACRDELQAAGTAFRSTSDTEVMLALCAERGVEKAVRAVNGMFAFAYFDEPAGALYLTRDRAGQKPLYYALLDDGSLVYASEIPALLAAGLIDASDLDGQAMDHFWTLGYTTGERTFYRRIRRLLPGAIARWHNGQWSREPYWQLRFEPEESPGKRLDQYVDELVPLLEDAVRIRLRSDVPVGLCLSGGVDSALMALMISRLGADVPAYTVAFDEQAHDESPYAAALAHHLNIAHEHIPVTADMSPAFARIAGWYGEPFGDLSCIPSYFLFKHIRRHAKVALTGDGGDELFGGYNHYRAGLRLWGSQREPRITRMVRMMRADGLYAVREQVKSLLGVERGYSLMQRHVNGALRRRLYGPAMRGRFVHAETLRERRQWMTAAVNDVLSAMQDCDFHTYMTDDVHRKVDGMSMAHGLECRSPFMDHRVMEFAARLPARIKISPSGEGKHILRHLLSRFIPDALHRRPKQGFTPPWEAWCVGAMREELRREWRETDDPYVQPDAIDELVPPDGNGSPILSWMAFSYVQWRRGM